MNKENPFALERCELCGKVEHCGPCYEQEKREWDAKSFQLALTRFEKWKRSVEEAVTL